MSRKGGIYLSANGSRCGQVHKIGYHGIEESMVEDLPMVEKRLYLHVVKRRHKCPVDNCIHIESIPWLKRYSRVWTKLPGILKLTHMM